jgi:putative ABC transport system permease protein
MRPAWRLGISSLSARRSRSALLVATVALSCGLIAAVACAMSSMHKGIRQRVDATVGAADLRVQRIGKDLLDQQTLDQISAWPEVELAVGRVQGALALKNSRTGKELSTVGNGLVPEKEKLLRPLTIVDGRLPTKLGEIALETFSAETLEGKVGDRLDVQRFGDPITLEVVGIVKGPALGIMSRAETFVSLEQMQLVADRPGKLREIDVLLKDPRAAETVERARADDLPKGVVIRASSKITTGLNKNLESSQIGMTIASVLAFLAASFIIMTGLTTGVTERQRELAMVRCIGGTRAQMAESQLVIGLVIGLIGAAIGVPLGTFGAFVVVSMFPDQLPGGFALNPLGLALAAGGSIFAGLLGAVWPAVRAARTSPLEALAIRSKAPTLRGLLTCLVVGAALAGLHIAILSLARDANVAFWADMTVGIPAMFAGYFLMAVPVTVAVALVLGPIIARVLKLPRGVLTRGILATPYRFGFTAGAMMMGLALLVAIWTNGRAVMRDWLGTLEFPDAFVSGVALSERTQDRIAALPFVKDTAAITIQNFRTDAFGITAFDNAHTSFVGFDPEAFFRMTKLTWVQGDPETAVPKLVRGGAVIVAREFYVTRGITVGDTLTLTYDGTPYPFEVVGVVASPGLDIVSKWFDIGDEYLDQAVNAVFGSRDDLKKIFGNTAINLVQIQLSPDISDEAAMKEIRKLAGFEVVAAGSGREIKAEITGFLSGSLLIFSIVAIASMLVACFGVANLVIAGIQARQFEFGVLRAVGAPGGLLVRLVIAEALVIALAACFLGTLMGTQASWAGQRMYELILGLLLTLKIPIAPTAMGWGVVILITLGAAAPAIWKLSGKRPRELLGVVRG